MTEGVPIAPGRGVLAAALISFVLAAAVRLPSLSLPIEGDAVAYGALAKSLATGRGYTIDDATHDRYPPLWPALLSLPVAAGVPVTLAARATAALLGALAAALAAVLAGQLARTGRRRSPPRSSWGRSVALHPCLALFAGGLVPGSEAIAARPRPPRSRSSPRASRGRAPRGRACAASGPPAPDRRAPLRARRRRALVFARGRGGGRGLGRLLPAVLVCLPVAAWVVRAFVLSGSPLGAGYAAHAPSLARIPKNLLVLGRARPACGGAPRCSGRSSPAGCARFGARAANRPPRSARSSSRRSRTSR